MLLQAPPALPRGPSRTGPGWSALTAAPLLVAAALTLPFLGSSPLWADEADSASAALRPLPDLLRLLGHQDAPLGAYYLMLHGWVRVAGASAPALRLPSTVALLVAVALTARLGRRLGGRAVGLLAGLLLAANPFVASFGTQARPYAFALAAAVGASALLLTPTLPQDPGRGRRAAYAGVVVLGVLSHLFFVLVVLAHLLGLRLAHRPLRPWLLPTALAGLVTAPLVALAAGQTREVGYLHPPGALSLPGWFQALAGGAGWLSVPAAAGLAWAVATGRTTRSRDGVLLSWLLVPGPVLLLVSLVHPLYLNRYVVESAPALSLLLAAALCRTRGRRSLAVAAGVLVLSLGTTASAQAAPYRYENLHAAADLVLDGAAPGDGAVFLPAPVRTAVGYYLRRLDPGAPHPADLLAAPAHGENQDGNFGGTALAPTAARRHVLTHRTVWLVRYADASAARGATAQAVLAALQRCFAAEPASRFGQVLVQRETLLPACRDRR